MNLVHRFCKHGVMHHPQRPGCNEHVVITSIDGRRIDMRPIYDFYRAVGLAMQIADLKCDSSISVHMRCWHNRDLCHALGIDAKILVANISIGEAITTAKEALRDSQDSAEHSTRWPN